MKTTQPASIYDNYRPVSEQQTAQRRPRPAHMNGRDAFRDKRDQRRLSSRGHIVREPPPWPAFGTSFSVTRTFHVPRAAKWPDCRQSASLKITQFDYKELCLILYKCANRKNGVSPLNQAGICDDLRPVAELQTAERHPAQKDGRDVPPK